MLGRDFTDKPMNGRRPIAAFPAVRGSNGAMLASACVVTGVLGLQLVPDNFSATTAWGLSGIAVGGLLRVGPGIWPGVFAGAFLLDLVTTGRPVLSLVMAIGTTLEALAAWWLVTRWAGGVAAFDHARTVFRFAFLGGMAAPLVGATTGAAALAFAEAAEPDVLLVWVTWWLGDALSIILVAPLIALWSRPPRRPWTRARALETTAVVAIICVASWAVFIRSPAGIRPSPLPSFPLPLLLWPAFRLGARETSIATMLLATIAIASTTHGIGPFVRSSPHESLLHLLVFLGVWSVVMLAVSVEVDARERVDADLRALNDTLEQRVAARTEELSRTRDRLAEAQRVANVGSWEWDVLSNTIWWSDELFRIFRRPRIDSLTYQDYVMLLHPDDRLHVESVIGKALADGRPFSFEHRTVCPDGSVRTIQGNGHVAADASGQPVRVVGTGRDVTDRHRAEEERMRRLREQAARVEAESANRAKDEFLATLSHELRTPLNAALGWAQMLRDVVHDPERRGRATDAVMRNLQSQSRLVSDMMDASHIALRTLRLETEIINMEDVIRGAVDSATDPDTGVRFDLVLPATPLYVEGDAGRLQQVVWNLLSNAAKFARDAGTVTVTLGRDGETIRLTVQDDGPGIDPAFLPYLFHRFRQADPSVTRAHGGLGLGLAIARHLVEAHGGTIEAANRPAGGATFTVRLPVAASVPA